MKWIELQHDEDSLSRPLSTDDDVDVTLMGTLIRLQCHTALDFAEQHGFSYDMVMKDDNDHPDLDDLVWLTDSAVDWSTRTHYAHPSSKVSVSTISTGHGRQGLRTLEVRLDGERLY